jgi:uncharacterized membrane protein
MATVEKSIEVEVPVSAAYNQWTQFEDFPRFMEGVEQVRQLDDKHLEWDAEIGGHHEHWQAEITSQVPDEKIAWRSIDGAENVGIVTFHPIADGKTEVHLRIEYQPDGVVETAGELLGIVSRRVEGDLERFKDFVESHGATGAWRGHIHAGEVKPGDAASSSFEGSDRGTLHRQGRGSSPDRASMDDLDLNRP